MSVRWGGRGPGHLSRWPKAVSSSGPTPATTLAELLATNVYAVWNPADQSTASMSASRTTLVQVSADGPIGQRFDQKGSLDLVAGNDSQRPVLSGGLMTFDGLDDALAYSGALTDATLELFFLVRSGKTALTLLLNNVGATPGLNWQDGSALSAINTGSGTIHVDGGASLATRDNLQNAAGDDAIHTVEWRGMEGGEFTNGVRFSAPATSAVDGVLEPICILNADQADIADQRTAAAAYLAALYTHFGF